jgi:hypothetical protein
LYKLTAKATWKTQAEIFTEKIEGQQYDRTSHDVGFQIYCSAGNGYRLTKNEKYKAIIMQAAATLSKRFSPVTGTIKSWDKPNWDYPTIIDNMMNLELLFEATKLSGDSLYYKIAVTHANTTIKNHFRTDHSSYHLVDYDSATGKVIRKMTVQGYADESAWARGQAWALYGFTMCYRETNDPVYLRQAEHIAAFILNNPGLPNDLIPYWDFNAPKIPADEPRDVSAAAIIASALYELSMYSKNKKYYLSKADKIIETITLKYRSPVNQNKGFLLLHSTGSKPANSEIDVPLIYADYYYLEALIRSKTLREKRSIF